MPLLQDFSYCKATNTCCMGLIFRNLFLVNTSFYVHPNRTKRRIPNETDSDVAFSRSCDQGKITEKDWNIIMDVYLIFWAKFQNCPISTFLI